MKSLLNEIEAKGFNLFNQTEKGATITHRTREEGINLLSFIYNYPLNERLFMKTSWDDWKGGLIEITTY